MVTVTTTAFDNIPADLDMDQATTYTNTSSTSYVSCSPTHTIDNGIYYMITMNGAHKNSTGGYTYIRMLLDGAQEYEISLYGYGGTTSSYGMGISKERQNTTGSAQSMTFEIRVTAGSGWCGQNWTLIRATEPLRNNALVFVCPNGGTAVSQYKLNIEDYYFMPTSHFMFAYANSSDYFTYTYNTTGYWYGYTGIMDGVAYTCSSTSTTGNEVTDKSQLRMPDVLRNCVVTTGFAGQGVSTVPDSANATDKQLTAIIVWAKGTKISVT